MSEDVIDSKECAELLRATVETVEELARSGYMPALKIGRSWLFLRDDLIVFLAEKAREEAQERRTKHRVTAAAKEGGWVKAGAEQHLQAPPHPPPNAEGTASERVSEGDGHGDGRHLVTSIVAAKMLSIGHSTFWREVKLGRLPQPIKIAGSTRWRVADLLHLTDRGAVGKQA